MRSILAPSMGGAVRNQGLYEPVGSFLGIVVVFVKDNADDMVWSMVLISHYNAQEKGNLS